MPNLVKLKKYILALGPGYDPQDIRARKDQCFSNFQSRKAFFRTEILMRILVYKTSEKITLAPHLGLAFPLGDPQRTLRPMVQSSTTVKTSLRLTGGERQVQSWNPCGCFHGPFLTTMLPSLLLLILSMTWSGTWSFKLNRP